ncbi:DUF4350 domain-containing protein [Cochleicola gelatinilyticus]|uniref:DUF4350 domain-containing protein n=1 Tax=Cochleicola gelatinilyticus TaxID=1763537 RepID=A0A167G9U4_9FLAO|nr:DUF4350 domain-containing protein [Cochleicola gelatinilyticus]OAB77367.1 hypothetical protein ULVI_12770 [Cochleicola gelatinilyticus]
MLDKRSRNILVLFGIAILSVFFIEVSRPKPINWNPSFTSEDKIPFGSHIFFEELTALFQDVPIERIEKDPFEFLKQRTYVDNSAYIFINDNLYIDDKQLEELKIYVDAGNTVFISARDFGYVFEDSLNIRTEANYKLIEESLQPTFFNTSEKKKDSVTYKKGVYKSVFTVLDTLKTEALGYFKTDAPTLQELNFIRLPYGKGTFLLHTLPETFSNYYLLHGNETYTAAVASYIKADHIYWDGYLKSGRKVVTSKMRFIFNQKVLTWSYYVLMAGLLLFVIFRGKREQRIIEVVEPLQNTSIEFTKTIGDLYFQHKDYGNIIAKKITYFLETIRSRYYLNTDELDETFIKRLALKSGNNKEETEKLIKQIKYLKEKSLHNEQDLIRLNKLIEDFKL